MGSGPASADESGELVNVILHVLDVGAGSLFLTLDEEARQEVVEFLRGLASLVEESPVVLICDAQGGVIGG